MSQDGSLRERKQRRVREAIVEAAHELFAERGYDNVTVADIAARAEVGRATFFRYFGDKQEVVFGGEQHIETATTDTGRAIGDSLSEAMANARTLLVDFVAHLVEEPDAYARHEQLVAGNPELLARSLVKQRRHVAEMTALLERDGAGPDTAALAAELALACFYAGRNAADNDPLRLLPAIEAAFDQLQTAFG